MPITDPVVSVLVMAYNHARFVAQALDSVLRQRTVFPVEIIVSEDCSTDGTLEIVQEYARQHPHVRLMLSPANLNTNRVMSRAIEAATGRYVALLDGDDYWTADDKLQAQIDVLESAPDMSVCFHDAIIVDDEGSVLKERYLPPAMARLTGLDDIVIGNYVPSCSIVFRRDTIATLPQWFERASFGDWPLLILAAMRGSLGCIDRPLGAYRRHGGGVWSGLSQTDQIRETIKFLGYLEESLTPSFSAKIRQSRVGWRVHLFDFLATRGAYDVLDTEIAAAVRGGDVAYARMAGGTLPQAPAVTDARARISVGFDTPRTGCLEEDGLPGGHIDEVRASSDGTTLFVRGWARMHDQEPCPVIVVDPGAQEVDVAIARLPRPDVAAAVDPSLTHSGLWLRLSSHSALREPLRLSTAIGNSRYRAIGVVRAS